MPQVVTAKAWQPGGAQDAAEGLRQCGRIERRPGARGEDPRAGVPVGEQRVFLRLGLKLDEGRREPWREVHRADFVRLGRADLAMGHRALDRQGSGIGVEVLPAYGERLAGPGATASPSLT